MRLRENDCVMMDGCLTICVFPRFLRIAHSHWHVLIFYPSNAMCLFKVVGVASTLCYGTHTHFYFSLTSDSHTEINSWLVGRKDVQHFVVNKLPTTLNMKIDLRMRSPRRR